MTTNSISFFFFNTTATTEIYTLSLHDALPILRYKEEEFIYRGEEIAKAISRYNNGGRVGPLHPRSEEHTSELQSHSDLVCRLLLEKKKTKGRQKAIARDNARNREVKLFPRTNE